MVDNKIGNILVPNNIKVGKREKDDWEGNHSLTSKKNDDFEKILNKKVNGDLPEKDLKFSGHASKRLKERELVVDSSEYLKLKDGVNKLKNMGGQDSLIITNNAAYIVDVSNSTIVTALDKNKMQDNVFTNIDSTLILT
jgi:flagellar operon protein